MADFLFDDFFANPAAPGLPVSVQVRGIDIPFTLKQNLSLKDINEARSQAVKMAYSPDGTPRVVSTDEGIFNIELLARSIKSWPFKNADGSPVEITRENINLMAADVVSALMQVLLNIIQKGKADLNGPFVKASGEAS